MTLNSSLAERLGFVAGDQGRSPRMAIHDRIHGVPGRSNVKTGSIEVQEIAVATDQECRARGFRERDEVVVIWISGYRNGALPDRIVNLLSEHGEGFEESLNLDVSDVAPELLPTQHLA